MCIELNDRIKKKVEWRHARLQREDLINLASIIAAKKKERDHTSLSLSAQAQGLASPQTQRRRARASKPRITAAIGVAERCSLFFSSSSFT
jgi:hypothetical protein